MINVSYQVYTIGQTILKCIGEKDNVLLEMIYFKDRPIINYYKLTRIYVLKCTCFPVTMMNGYPIRVAS